MLAIYVLNETENKSYVGDENKVVLKVYLKVQPNARSTPHDKTLKST